MDNASYISPDTDNLSIEAVWREMETDKGDLVERCKEYARLTIPSICPDDDAGRTEQEKGNVMIGARAVSHLSNKIVNILFPHDRPFFGISLSPEAEFKLAAEVPSQQLAQAMESIQKEGRRVVRFAVSKLNLVSYRPLAVDAVKHTIITGNAVIRRFPDGTRAVYGVKDIGVFRHINGTPYDIILRDATRVDGLETSVRNALIKERPGVRNNTVVSMYTRWRKVGDKWEVTQAVDTVPLSTFKMVTERNLDVVLLTWSLARGENYGRGAVEDNIALFSSVDVATTALLDLYGIAADIKFFIKPGSVIDVVEVNESRRGSYHVGDPADIGSPEIGRQKAADIQVLSQDISNWSQEIAQIFLMTSGGIRQAERVTAEEIRLYAAEVESAFGGMYSRMCMQWQKPEAEWCVSKVINSVGSTMQVEITTGLDAISDEAKLENMRMSLNDLGLLNTVPEDVRGQLDTVKIADYIFGKRNISFEAFTLTKEQLQERQQQQQAAAEQQMNMETNAAVAQAAGRAAAQE